MFRLDGRSAIVTGAGSGIGAAVAIAFADAGAAVLVTDIDAAAAEAVAKSVNDSGATAQWCALDVRDASAEDVTVPGQEKFLRPGAAPTIKVRKPDGETKTLDRGRVPAP